MNLRLNTRLFEIVANKRSSYATFSLAVLICLVGMQADLMAQRYANNFGDRGRLSRNVKPAERVVERTSDSWLIQEPVQGSDPIRPALESPRDTGDFRIQDPRDQENGSGSTVPDWPAKSIREVRIDVRESGGRFPDDRSIEMMSFGGPVSRPASAKVFAWAAPNIKYQPLYFEEVALERYGQTLPPNQQAVASGIHFFKSLVTLPHQMRHDAPSSCDYPLGFCRPGNTISYTIQRHYFGRPTRTR